jgi:predicted XRE-type DNA-binding protein
MTDDTIVHESTRNVFADMGMADAEIRLAKAELARVLRKVLEERRIDQGAASVLLGITGRDVADLTCGKLARFSMERLERFLNALDVEIRIQVGPRPAWKERAEITVEVVAGFWGTPRQGTELALGPVGVLNLVRLNQIWCIRSGFGAPAPDHACSSVRWTLSCPPRPRSRSSAR